MQISAIKENNIEIAIVYSEYILITDVQSERKPLVETSKNIL